MYHLIFALCLHGGKPCMPVAVTDPKGTHGYETEQLCREAVPVILKRAAEHAKNLPEGWAWGGYVCTNHPIPADPDGDGT